MYIGMHVCIVGLLYDRKLAIGASYKNPICFVYADNHMTTQGTVLVYTFVIVIIILNRLYVMCDYCGGQFHTECIDLEASEEDINRMHTFKCPACELSGQSIIYDPGNTL